MAAGALPEGVQVSPVTQPLHGLVLLCCWPSTPAAAGYFVCNPSTGAVLPLPDTRSPLRTMVAGRKDPYTTRDSHVRYGLGYSEMTREYKVVRVFCRRHRRDGETVVETSCEVLVLDASRQWQPAAGGRPPRRSFDHHHGGEAGAVYFNGALHFLCDDGDGSVIPTFDVRDETFGELSPAGQAHVLARQVHRAGRAPVLPPRLAEFHR